MTKPKCACGATTKGSAYLCRACQTKTVDELRELSRLVDELLTTAYRQDHLAAVDAPNVAGGRERPLPFKPKAAAELQRVYRITGIWSVAFLPGTLEPRYRYRHTETRRDLERLARAMTTVVALHPDAPAFADSIAGLAAGIRPLIDLPPDSHRPLGPCRRCKTPMRVPRDATTYVCPCGATYDVERRVAAIVRASRNVVAPPATIATALTTLDRPVTEERIRKWRERGKITARSLNGPRRQPWYRMGDVLDLLDAETAARQNRDTSKRQNRLQVTR